MHLLYSLILIAMVFGLSCCDSLKSKALAIVDQKIEETGGNSDSSQEIGLSENGTATYGGDNQKSVRHLTINEYLPFTETKGHVVVVDFYADWCGPCRQLAPILDRIVGKSKGEVILAKVDIDKNKGLARREGVGVIPDVRMYIDGKLVDKFVGVPPVTEVNRRINAQLTALKKSTTKANSEFSKAKPSKPNSAKLVDKAQPADKPRKIDNSGEHSAMKPMDKDWLPSGMRRKRP